MEKRKLTEIEKLQIKVKNLIREFETKNEEFEKYIKRHKSLSYAEIQTKDTNKLEQIYKYFDNKYPIEWQSGLRNDHRGMALIYWLFDKDDYIVMHLSSTCENFCFSGSTSWLVYAPTLEEKIKAIKQIKKDMLKILK